MENTIKKYCAKDVKPEYQTQNGNGESSNLMFVHPGYYIPHPNELPQRVKQIGEGGEQNQGYEANHLNLPPLDLNSFLQFHGFTGNNEDGGAINIEGNHGFPRNEGDPDVEMNNIHLNVGESPVLPPNGGIYHHEVAPYYRPSDPAHQNQYYGQQYPPQNDQGYNGGPGGPGGYWPNPGHQPQPQPYGAPPVFPHEAGHHQTAPFDNQTPNPRLEAEHNNREEPLRENHGEAQRENNEEPNGDGEVPGIEQNVEIAFKIERD